MDGDNKELVTGSGSGPQDGLASFSKSQLDDFAIQGEKIKTSLLQAIQSGNVTIIRSVVVGVDNYVCALLPSDVQDLIKKITETKESITNNILQFDAMCISMGLEDLLKNFLDSDGKVSLTRLLQIQDNEVRVLPTQLQGYLATMRSLSGELTQYNNALDIILADQTMVNCIVDACDSVLQRVANLVSDMLENDRIQTKGHTLSALSDLESGIIQNNPLDALSGTESDPKANTKESQKLMPESQSKNLEKKYITDVIDQKYKHDPAYMKHLKDAISRLDEDQQAGHRTGPGVIGYISAMNTAYDTYKQALPHWAMQYIV